MSLSSKSTAYPLYVAQLPESGVQTYGPDITGPAVLKPSFK